MKHFLQSQHFVTTIRVALIFSLAPLLFPPPASSQQNTIRTRVGIPKEADIIKVGRDIKSAYDVCNDGYTYERPDGNLGQCLRQQLSSSGYADPYLEAFEARRLQSLVTQPKVGKKCTQCLGFLGIVFALATGDRGALSYYSAGRVAVLDSFTINGVVWKKIPPGEDPIQGDIGAYGDYNNVGHIVFVLDVLGSYITALESNGGSSYCRITDDQPRIKEQLVYFRST